MPSAFGFPSRLYAILDVDVVRAQRREVLGVLDAWLDVGVRVIQLRAKTLSGGPFLLLADEAIRRSRQAGAHLIVNDRADVAVMAGADGVHVGQDDLSPSAVRRLVGEGRWVGLSTHTEAQTGTGVGEPVTYLAIGPVFSTSTKHQAYGPVGLTGVRAAADRCRPVRLPLVAIGGITLGTAPRVIAAGASAVAVIGDLLVGDAAARARAFLTAVGDYPAGAIAPPATF